MKRWLFLIALGLAGGLIVRQVLFEGVYVASPSMEPTLPVGTHYFVNKITPLYRPYERKDIVVFPSPVDPDKDLIKRVIGLPGETIEIREKKVFIDGQPLEEPYAQFTRKDELLVGDIIAPMKIPADSYFVMGDNRDESGDSRDWKNPETGEHVYFVKKSDIKGLLFNTLE